MEIKRIPQLDPNNILPSNGLFAWYDPVTDETYKITASSFLSALFSPDDAWNPGFEYSIGDIVTYQGQVWISEENTNTGNPPGPDSDFWELEPDPPVAGGLEIVTLDTSPVGTINVNVQDQKELCFNGSANITEDKVWSFSNFSHLVLIPFIRFTISGGLHTQQLPVNSKLANANNADWNSGTREWTPLEVGEYEARVTYNGTQFNWTIAGPF